MRQCTLEYPQNLHDSKVRLKLTANFWGYLMQKIMQLQQGAAFESLSIVFNCKFTC